MLINIIAYIPVSHATNMFILTDAKICVLIDHGNHMPLYL